MAQMNFNQAKEQLKRFSGGQVLTFTVSHFENGTWSAQCDQIPAVSTCGTTSDANDMEELMKDSILTAAGIDGKYADRLLRDASVKKQLALTV